MKPNPESLKDVREESRIKVSDAEAYFIQFMFCENRALLGYEYKNLYRAMLDAYQDVYKEGRKAGVDLSDINKKYKAIL